VVPLYVSTADGERSALSAKKVAKVVPLYVSTADGECCALIAKKVAKVVPLYVSTADGERGALIAEKMATVPLNLTSNLANMPLSHTSYIAKMPLSQTSNIAMPLSQTSTMAMPPSQTSRYDQKRSRCDQRRSNDWKTSQVICPRIHLPLAEFLQDLAVTTKGVGAGRGVHQAKQLRADDEGGVPDRTGGGTGCPLPRRHRGRLRTHSVVAGRTATISRWT